jgi:hypothetical protein
MKLNKTDITFVVDALDGALSDKRKFRDLLALEDKIRAYDSPFGNAQRLLLDEIGRMQNIRDALNATDSLEL